MVHFQQCVLYYFAFLLFWLVFRSFSLVFITALVFLRRALLQELLRFSLTDWEALINDARIDERIDRDTIKLVFLQVGYYLDFVGRLNKPSFSWSSRGWAIFVEWSYAYVNQLSTSQAAFRVVKPSIC